MTAAEAKGDSSPAYSLGPISHSPLTAFLSMTVICEPYLKISVSFHLPFVEFGQNAPDELIRVARAMSVNKLGMERERRDIRVPLSILPIVIYTLQLLRNLTSFDQSLWSLNMSPMANC